MLSQLCTYCHNKHQGGTPRTVKESSHPEAVFTVVGYINQARFKTFFQISRICILPHERKRTGPCTYKHPIRSHLPVPTPHLQASIQERATNSGSGQRRQTRCCRTVLRILIGICSKTHPPRPHPSTLREYTSSVTGFIRKCVCCTHNHNPDIPQPKTLDDRRYPCHDESPYCHIQCEQNEP